MLAHHVLHHLLDHLGSQFLQFGGEQLLHLASQSVHFNPGRGQSRRQQGSHFRAHPTHEAFDQRCDGLGAHHVQHHARGGALQFRQLALNDLVSRLRLQNLHQRGPQLFVLRGGTHLVCEEALQVILSEEVDHDQVLYRLPDLAKAVGDHPGTVEQRDPVKEHLNRQPVGDPAGQAE